MKSTDSNRAQYTHILNKLSLEMTCLLLLFHIFLILHLSVCQNPHEEKKNIINSSSMDNLTKLLKIEEELLKNLNAFAKQMQKKLNMIKL